MLKTTTPPPEPDTRLVSPREAGDDVALDITLRPRTLAEFIGQEKIKQSLTIFLQAAKSRGETIDHVLLYGPPGIGKTSLANIIAREMGASIKTTSGPAIERAGDLASLLTNLEAGDVLFIDEIHRLPRAVEEVLYPAMEDWSLDIILGKGPGARSVKLDLPRFTLIGATTRYAALSSPLRDRFGSVYRLDFYEPEEIASIIERSGRILGSTIDAESAQVIALRSRRTPRVANRLLKRVRDYAQVKGDGTITPSAARQALAMLAIDDLGLDDNDRRILNVLIEKFNGGPVGASTLAASTSEEIDTIEDVYEPYLMRVGLLARTPKGRVATPRAYEHLGKTPPQKSLL